MLLELHIHTSRHSPCANLEPVAAVRRVVDKGLQGMVITEHEVLWTDEELGELRRRAELDESFVLLAGQEVETDLGHVLILGADRSLEGQHRLSDLRKRYPRAVLIWAHPFRYDSDPSDEKLQSPLWDAVEIFNSNHTARGNYCALSAWHRLKFNAVGGSDAHAEDTVGLCPTQLDHPVVSMDQLVEEIRRGRCRPFFKEIPKSGSNVAVTEITIGTKGHDEHRQRIVVRRIRDSGKWRRQRRSLDTIRSLHDHGFRRGTFRVPVIIEVNDRDRLLIEEGQRGRLLFELLTGVSPDVAKTYVELAVRWLARMHSRKLQVGTVEDSVAREQRRSASYLRAFVDSRSPYREQVEQIVRLVDAVQGRLFREEKSRFVQVHGDYHPKNIIIGQDRAQDISTVFVSVIDFVNSLLFLPAFDLGYFLAQFRYQFRDHPQVVGMDIDSLALQVYAQEARGVPDDLWRQVSFFELRGAMSIAAYLVKVGKGESPDMEELMGRMLDLKRRLSA